MADSISCAKCGRTLYVGPGPFPKHWSGEEDTPREPCPDCGDTGRSYSVHVSDEIPVSDHVEARVLLRSGPLSVVAGEALDVKVGTYGAGTYGSSTYGNPTAELEGMSAGTSSMTGTLNVEVQVPTRPGDALQNLFAIGLGIQLGSMFAAAAVNTLESKLLGMALGGWWGARIYNRLRSK